MNAKLTLSLNKDLIKKAKTYASKKGKSISALVSDYLSLLLRESEEEEKLPPKLASLKGILKSQKVSEDDYRKYLERKYL